MNENKCIKCGSLKVVPDAILSDQGQHSDGKAKMAVHENPSAWILKGTTTTEVKGSICCDCGHLELRCEGDLETIWHTWLRGMEIRKAAAQ